MVSQSSLSRFKLIYKQETGVDLLNDEAYELATNLVNLYRSVYIKDTKSMKQNYETKLQPTQNKN